MRGKEKRLRVRQKSTYYRNLIDGEDFVKLVIQSEGRNMVKNIKKGDSGDRGTCRLEEPAFPKILPPWGGPEPGFSL